MDQEEMEKTVLQPLRTFVRFQTRDRDASHGYEHMNEVAQKSYSIWKAERVRGVRKLPPILLVMAAALLHDVPDRKYDHDGSLRGTVQEYLQEDPHLEPMSQAILWIIDNVSLSKEKRFHGANLSEKAGSVIGYARDIVSDADKCCAIGEEGYWRCWEYTKKKIGISEPRKIRERVNAHAKDKLLQLLPGGYFRTASGRQTAQPLHEDLKELVYSEQSSEEEMVRP